MLVELTVLLVSGYGLIWMWLKLSGPAPVQSLRAENSCFVVSTQAVCMAQQWTNLRSKMCSHHEEHFRLWEDHGDPV